MIKIEERICEKLSGVTSLFLSFDYNEKIISWIKQTFELYVYNKKTHEWELPINCLAQILDNLSAFDDLNVNLYKEQEHLLKRNITSFNYKLKPFKHQEEAILFGVNREKFLLLDDMGLGKTASIIHIAEELKKDGLQHCLIVCGLATLRGNWKKEIGLHSYESCRIIGERVGRNGNSHYATIGERIAELTKPIDEFFLVVNIETLRSDDFINAIKLGPNKIDMIVVDEVHKCVGYDTMVFTDKGMLKIGDIVTKNIDCLVLSQNTKTESFEYRKIVSRFSAMHHNDILKLTFEDDQTKQRVSLICTADHLIKTKNRGFIKASLLTASDELVMLN